MTAELADLDRPPLYELDEQTADWTHDAADPAVRARWPARLAELQEVIAAQLRRGPGVDAAGIEEIAAQAAAAIARVFGGRVIYLPLGEELDRGVLALRLYRGWLAHRGATADYVDAAVRRYRCSHDTVYAAIREGRARHLALIQGRLL